MQITGSISDIASVAVSTTTAVLSNNRARKYLIVHNASGQDLYLAYGGTATSSVGGYSVIVADGSSYEVPGVYQGDISGITSSGSGNVSVTTIT